MRLGTFALVGCAGFQGPPTLTGPSDDSGVFGALEVRARTAAPCRLDITATSDDHEIRREGPEANDHALVLWGLREDRAYTLSIMCGADSQTVPWNTEPLPTTLPERTVFAYDPAGMEPGYTLLDLSGPRGTDWLVVLDEALEIVWGQQQPAPGFLSVLAEPEGTLLGNRYPTIERIDWMGRRSTRWTPEPSDAADVGMTWPLHHEAVPRPDGRILGLTWRPLEVDAYPVSESEPDTFAPATIADDGVIEFAPDGSVETLHWLSDALDTRRIGFDSLSSLPDDGTVRDWAHANAVVPTPSGGFLVTLRHQDAVVHLTENGERDWILGAPGGWRGEFADARLEPVGEVHWPFHPHAADIAPDGSILVFDNGNHGATPYDEARPTGPRTSRVVGYRVDPVARTVSQAWEYRETQAGTLYTPAFGDADLLPRSGNVLAMFGRTREIDGVPNRSAGRPDVQAHLIEFDPATSTPFLHLVFAGPEARSWSSYRAHRFDPGEPE